MTTMKFVFHSRFLHTCLVCVLGCGIASLANAQTPCQVPAFPTGTSEANIFSPQQEIDLGDAVAEHLQRNFHVIYDEEVTARLQHLGETLLQRLPATNLQFQFILYDQPEANAFALPGGRIYVSRKLIAFVKTDDELAGVLAHEIGHIVTHQTVIDVTRLFKEVLGVTLVTDHRDIFDKYNQLMENAARKPKAFAHNEEEKKQLAADRVALLTMAAAGYDPHAFTSFWDRFAGTKGKTGSWFSDLFGTTKPEVRRLREMFKSLSSLPPECLTIQQSASVEDFQKWQTLVINYSGLGRKEVLHGVVSKKNLEPPLRGDVTYLRFSPDGKYVLAQDDSGINVLSRDPFAPLFRINAPEAYPAHFSPDSQTIIFYNTGLRVEFWSVAEERVIATHELVIRDGCLQSALSPDGKVLACLDPTFNLTLFETASGSQVFQKKSFYLPNPFELLLNLLNVLLGNETTEFLSMAFSPDAHYFVAAHGDAALAVDLASNASVPMRGAVKRFITGPFAFVAPDRLVGTDNSNIKKSALVSFPAGEILSELSVGSGHLAAASHGDYLFIRPIKDFPVGIMDLSTKKIFMANKQSAVDIYDQVFVGEQRNGELALYDLATGKALAKVLLAKNPLGRLHAVALSKDMKWLAVSERCRGAVWDLTKNERLLHVRGFRGAFFSDDGTFYGDFPKFEQTERVIAKMDLKTRRVVESSELQEETHAFQSGKFLVVTKPAKKDGSLRENVTVEVRNILSGQTLWSINFPKEAPTIWSSAAEESLVLSWAVSSKAAKAEIKNDPQISQRLAAMKEKEGDYFLQVVDTRSGKVTGRLLIETGMGSFRISSVFAAGDWVVISDSNNRILIYSLRTGEQQGRMFGSQAAIARTSGLLVVENEPGKLTIYDPTTMSKSDEFVFSSPVSLAQFTPDGKRLFVLTANQTIYLLELSDHDPRKTIGANGAGTQLH